MKLPYLAYCAVALVALTHTPFTVAQGTTAQDSPTPAATTYTYRAINAPAASATYAYAINNGGEIVGVITGGDCAQTSDQSSCGFVDVKGAFTTVACELENATDFFDISNTNEVVGAYSFFGGVNGLIWEGNEACSPLADPSGSAFTEAWGVNVKGNIVGFYIDSAGIFQGFEYLASSATYKTISCPGWTNTRAYGINDAGVIVGDVANSTTGPFSAMSFNSGKCTVFNFPSAAATYARGVNKSGEISGFYTTSTGVTSAFQKTGSKYTSLSFPKSTGSLAYHLNDKGQIAGWYNDTAGAVHGFVATPKAAADSQ